jgi:hypothetical protein
MGFGTRVFVLLCLIVFVFVPRSHASICSDSTGCYGPGIGSDGLANTVVGGTAGNIVSYRFRAGHTGSLQEIHVYLMQGHAGYSSGTGGQLRITVNTDDGTDAHNPSGTVLSTYLVNAPASVTPSIYFPIFVFAAPPSLIEGQLYHIVFTDVDASPTTNYLSVNAQYYENPSAPAQPTISDVDGAVLLGGPDGRWAPRKGYLPILELDYQDGFSEGNGYMEAWIGAPQNISGPAAVEETITVSGTQKNVASASIRIAHISGADPLIVRLENSDGTLVEEGTIPAAAIPLTNPASPTWTTFTFSSAHTLLPGQTYHLQFGAASTSTYQAYPIRKGLAYGFKNTTYFPDGYAGFNQNGSWVGWTQWGVANRTDGDLQFYFGLVPPAPPSPVISNAVAATWISAMVEWSTDQPSMSQIEYGISTSYAGLSSLDSSLQTNHSVVLSGLVANTIYHYRVISTNASGGRTVSGDLIFSTP